MDRDDPVLRIARRKRRQGEALEPHETQALKLYEEWARARSRRIYFETPEQRQWFEDQGRDRGFTDMSAFMVGLMEQRMGMEGFDTAQAQADRDRRRELEDYIRTQGPVVERLTRERDEWMTQARGTTDTLLRLINALQAQGLMDTADALELGPLPALNPISSEEGEGAST